MALMSVPKPKRRFLRFSLRTLLVLVVLSGLVMGWLGIVVERRYQQKRILEQLKEWEPAAEYRRGYVVSLWLQDGLESPIDEDLACLKGLTRLEFLDLSFTNVTDAGLLHLRDLERLHRLHLHGTQIGDAGLEHLKTMNTLSYLDLGGTNVTDNALHEFRTTLPHCSINPPRPQPQHRYKHLYGVRSDETGRILERIAGDDADIWFTEPPDLPETDDLPPMPTPEQWMCAESTVKAICFSPQKPDVLSDLGCFRELKALMLMGDVVTDDSVANLPVMERLEALTILSSPKFTGEGIKHLGKQPNLTGLTLCWIGVPDGPCLTYLADLNRLESLRLINTPIDDDSLERVGKLENLVRLELGDLGGLGYVRCNTLKPLSGLVNLVELELWGFQVDPTEYRHISGLSRLDKLRLEGGPLDDSVMRELGRLEGLTFLWLNGGGVTDAGLLYLKPLRNLRSLRFHWTSNPSIKGHGLVHLYQLKDLRYVSVHGASPEATEALRKALPNCKVD
jgi:Leucine-rich repeat (LRR) protein